MQGPDNYTYHLQVYWRHLILYNSCTHQEHGTIKLVIPEASTLGNGHLLPYGAIVLWSSKRPSSGNRAQRTHKKRMELRGRTYAGLLLRSLYDSNCHIIQEMVWFLDYGKLM